MRLLIVCFSTLIGIVIGFLVAGLVLRSMRQKEEERLLEAKKHANDMLVKAEKQANQILLDAEHDRKRRQKELELEAKEEAASYRREVEDSLEADKENLKETERRLAERSSLLDQKDAALTTKEVSLVAKEDGLSDHEKALDEREEKLVQLEEEKVQAIEKVAQLTQEEAKDLILMQTEEELTHEIAMRIRDADQQVEEMADKKAKDILSQAMERLASEYVADQTVTTVALEDDAMKGRIIGREGRNIRAFESLTGIDVIVDDTPETVLLSGFDPIRREVARLTMEALVADGRIHPARIEELVSKYQKEMDRKIREYGEAAVFEIGALNMHPDLIKIMGRLHFRTSYGQNVLRHSIEVAKLAGVMAAELGEDEVLARRAGFLHDIGKALDREVEGSHVEIGVELARKYKENPIAINAIASHHGDIPADNVISVLVAAADSLSAARPGSRRESMEAYIKRLQGLEALTSDYKGIKQSYAIQAGREVRVIVNPHEVTDDQMTILARKMKKQIEESLDYPGTIKITIIRETRRIETAK